MNFCSNCGNKISINDSYCVYCGNKINRIISDNSEFNDAQRAIKEPRFQKFELEKSIESKRLYRALLDKIYNKIKVFRDSTKDETVIHLPVEHLNEIKRDIVGLLGLTEGISPKDTVDKEEYVRVAKSIDNFISENIKVHGTYTLNNYLKVKIYLASNEITFTTFRNSDPFSYINDRSEMPGNKDFFDEIVMALEMNDIGTELIHSLGNRNKINEHRDFIIFKFNVSKLDLLITQVNEKFVYNFQQHKINHTVEIVEEIIDIWENQDIDTEDVDFTYTEYFPIITEIFDPLILVTRDFNKLEISKTSIKFENRSDLSYQTHIRNSIKLMDDSEEFGYLHYFKRWANSEISGLFLSKSQLDRNNIVNNLLIKTIGGYPIGVFYDGEFREFNFGNYEEFTLKTGVESISEFDYKKLFGDK